MIDTNLSPDGKKPGGSRLFLDLETTGLDPRTDAILEIGALRVESGIETAGLELLVRPGRPVPEFITRLTGIDDEMIRERGVDLAEALARLAPLLEGAVVVGHNIDFDLRFLKTAGLAADGPALDTALLAALVRPAERAYSLSHLTRTFFDEREEHRALADARHSWRLFQFLETEARGLEPEFLRKMAALLAPAEPRLAEFFLEAADAAPPEPVRESGPAYGKARSGGRPAPETDPDRIAALLNEAGPFARVAGYEFRSQQAEMARLVARAFRDKEFLAVEAPTGTGKSLAYLLAAVHFAVSRQAPVVISTNTRNLQGQIWEKEIPQVRKALPGLAWKASRLLGQDNYFCWQSFHRIYAGAGNLNAADQAALAYLVSFSHLSREGLLSESARFLQNRFPVLRYWMEDLKAGGDHCAGPRCSMAGRCFYQRARLAAQQSDIIITNHALTLSPPANFPVYRHLILDEAHNIEDAAAEAHSRGVESETVAGLLSRLAAGQRKKKEGAALRLAAQETRAAWLSFSGLVNRMLPAGPPRALAALRNDPRWPEAEQRRSELLTRWQAMEAELEGAGKRQGVIADPDFQAEENEERGLALRARRHREDLQFIFNPADNYVSYGGRAESEREGWFLKSTPVELDALLNRELFDAMESVVFTSATLTVGRKFDFFLRRWGVESRPGLKAAQLASPFDFRRQALLAVPSNFTRFDYHGSEDLYVVALAEGIETVARTVGGKQLVLFAARRRMEAAYYQVKENLAGAGFAVLCQNLDGSRSHLAGRLREGIGNYLLFGTRSFQEGVDIPGLRAVLIEKMPFPGKQDPLLNARQQAILKRGGRPFQDYILPLAIISLRQAFGRLIRNRQDRGVVVIFDPRPLEEYPEALASLPDCPRIIADTPRFYEKLKEAVNRLYERKPEGVKKAGAAG